MAETGPPPPARTAPPPRLCEICDTNIDDLHANAKTCRKEACKAEQRNRRLRRNREEKAAAGKPDPQPQPEPVVTAGSEPSPATATLLSASSKPTADDTEERRSPDDDHVRQIEKAAERFLSACAVERTATQRRITAQRRLTEAISKAEGDT
ncbi:MAG: hypothetical protein F4Z31_02135 [Gemmatimonadetes bacterium]|nr:hypothetical protein [Gemmatimonadota bacterium]